MELTIEQLIDKIADHIYDSAANGAYEEVDFRHDIQYEWKNLLRKMIEMDADVLPHLEHISRTMLKENK